MTKDSIFYWIVRVIETCCHDFHFEAVDKLIELYYEKNKDDEIRTELKLLKQEKWNEIHFILS